MVMFLVVFGMSFHVFPENWPILPAFIVPLNGPGGLGAPLGFIFGALGLLWRLWGSSGAPLAAQGAQSQISALFPFHFGIILDPFWS